MTVLRIVYEVKEAVLRDDGVVHIIMSSTGHSPGSRPWSVISFEGLDDQLLEQIKVGDKYTFDLNKVG